MFSRVGFIERDHLWNPLTVVSKVVDWWAIVPETNVIDKMYGSVMCVSIELVLAKISSGVTAIAIKVE